MLIKESLALAGDPAVVWRRVSDLASFPSYWHGTRALEILDSRGPETRARFTFAFGGKGMASITARESERTLSIEFTSGPFLGTQLISVSDRAVSAVWDIRFRGAYRLLSKWNEGHFRSGTRNALLRLTASSE